MAEEEGQHQESKDTIDGHDEKQVHYRLDTNSRSLSISTAVKEFVHLHGAWRNPYRYHDQNEHEIDDQDEPGRHQPNLAMEREYKSSCPTNHRTLMTKM